MKRYLVILLFLVLSVFPGLIECAKNDSSKGNSADTGNGHKKAFIAGLMNESNTFTPFPTALSDFEREKGDEGKFMLLFKQSAELRGWSVAKGIIAYAPPAGLITRSAYEALKIELLSDLKLALPVNMVVLALHGAMVAQGYDDCQGDILQAIRDAVGKGVPIGTGLDVHAHLTQAMVDAADILVFFKEWPHIDADQTYKTAFNLTADCAEGKITPHMAVWDCRMIANFFTLQEPVKGLVDDMRAAEGKDGNISVSLIHGFSDADVPDMGTKVLIITNNLPEKGAELAERFGKRVFAMREKNGARQFFP